MPYGPFNFPLTGGQDRRVASILADKSTFYEMSNLRQSNTERGVIEPVPRFYVSRTNMQGTYWNGSASTIEPSASAVKFASPAMTEYCAFDNFHSTAATQVLIIRQTLAPTADGVTKGCLLVLDDPNGCSITLGSKYEVEIDGAATFKWRVNGGAWTTLVAIDATNGNVIDTGAHLYWLTGTGFTVTDAWAWTRDDCTNLAGVAYVKYVRSRDATYFLDVNGQIMKAEIPSSPTPAGYYIRSVGYKMLYGLNLNIYEDHLFLFGASSTSASGRYIYCSDLSNYDNFIATDVNEADRFDLDVTTAGTSQLTLILNGAVLSGRLFVLTSRGIYYTDYQGLPTPFSFKRIADVTYNFTYTSVPFLATPYGIFFASDYFLYRFDGAAVTEQVCLENFRVSTSLTPNVRHLVFSEATQELYCIMNQISAVVWQARYNSYYTRELYFSPSGCTAFSISSAGVISTGSGNRQAIVEDTAFSNSTPIKESAVGASFATPTLQTHLIDADLSRVKEAQPLYVAMYPTASGGSGYSWGTYIQMTVAWLTSVTGETPTAVSSTTWTSARTDGLISTRLNYRAVAFKLTFAGTNGTKPSGKFSLRQLLAQIYVVKNER